ncbi:hypothetical protein HOLleu_20414 [Holothuria leucospilota]|uniref:Uncharacterized protein n=1 Tax=Holothuria leucospilota TaxID=206669 RepID=A0A9Q1C1G2_HOLLE|nr:hypothetical protein HOLleu_20414 [Holothuria leucospilota]
MRTMESTIRAAAIEHRSWKQELYVFLRNYRATPHSSTHVSPAELLFGRPIRVKLPQIEPEPTDDIVRATDRQSKTKMKQYAEKKHSFKQSSIRVGDSVLVRQNKINKLTPPPPV